jgi:hypothetical protein
MDAATSLDLARRAAVVAELVALAIRSGQVADLEDARAASQALSWALTMALAGRETHEA